MKSALALTFLLLSSTALAAEWKELAKTDDVVIYLDVSSIAPSGHLVKAWTMRTFTVAQESKIHPPQSFQSKMILLYMDCVEKTLAEIQTVSFEGAMGKGKTVDSESLPIHPLLFKDVVPDSVGELILLRACSIRQTQRKRSGAK